MSEFGTSSEYLPEELLALASSIVQRNIAEQEWQQSILAETVPLPIGPPTEVTRSIQTGATVVMLKSLENPDAVLDPVEIARNVIDDKALDDILYSSGEEPEEESKAILRGLFQGTVKTIMEHFLSDESEKQGLVDRLNAAKTVADQHEVEICEVFDSDELYTELIRAQFTPVSYAAEMSEAIEKLNQSYAVASIENMIAAVLQADVASGEITPEEYEEEKAQMMQELMEDKSVVADMEATFSALRVASRNVIPRAIERFWGKEALPQTSAALGHIATEQATPELSESLRLQQDYNDAVKTLCMDKGWDPHKLSIEQRREISADPAMQDYLKENQSE